MILFLNALTEFGTSVVCSVTWYALVSSAKIFCEMMRFFMSKRLVTVMVSNR